MLRTHSKYVKKLNICCKYNVLAVKSLLIRFLFHRCRKFSANSFLGAFIAIESEHGLRNHSCLLYLLDTWIEWKQSYVPMFHWEQEQRHNTHYTFLFPFPLMIEKYKAVGGNSALCLAEKKFTNRSQKWRCHCWTHACWLSKSTGHEFPFSKSCNMYTYSYTIHLRSSKLNVVAAAKPLNMKPDHIVMIAEM